MTGTVARVDGLTGVFRKSVQGIKDCVAARSKGEVEHSHATKHRVNSNVSTLGAGSSVQACISSDGH